MTIIRLDNHCENLEELIENLINGNRVITPFQTAQILQELNDTIQKLKMESATP